MTEPIAILAIDDESHSLRELSIDLEEMGYQVMTGHDSEDGWEILQQNKNTIQAILLDQNMSGLKFMKKIKSVPNFAAIPVIMQTGSVEKTHVVKGIEAGVYYYLTYPYDQSVLISIVNAAITDYANYHQLRGNLKTFTRKLNLIKDARFEIATLRDVEYLSTFLSQYYPHPEEVIFGISELLINGIEHGNLGITYDEKTELKQNNTWEKEVKKRLMLPEHEGKKLIVSFARENTSISLVIKDEGEGFDWQQYMEISPERITDNHGRGIALSRMMSFDTIEYLGNGCEVVCRVNVPE